MSNVKTVEEVRRDFARKGIAFAEWARANGLQVPAVYNLLNGRTRGTRGDAHKAAVLLGLKEGEIAETAGAIRGAA